MVWHAHCERLPATMKTIFKLLPALLAAALPAAMATELAGISLPTAVDCPTLFSAFVVSVVMLTAVSDYSRSRRKVVVPAPASVEKSPHPLAA